MFVLSDSEKVIDDNELRLNDASTHEGHCVNLVYEPGLVMKKKKITIYLYRIYTYYSDRHA